ncbi:MAG: hypothetical protein HYZ13_07660 [Acidobacteria bacterium]|nr:hypothetical protein [Acidobacteriota bacterium]
MRAGLLAAVLGLLLGQVLQSTQAPLAQTEPALFRRGASWDRVLTGGEVQAFRLRGKAGDFLKVVAYQRGVDLVLRALHPTSDTEFFSGPRPALEYPVKQIYRFQRAPGTP